MTCYVITRFKIVMGRRARIRNGYCTTLCTDTHIRVYAWIGVSMSLRVIMSMFWYVCRSVRFRHATAPIKLISYPIKAKRSVGIPNNVKYANSAVQKLGVNFKNNSSKFPALAPNSIIYCSRLNEFCFRRCSFCTRHYNYATVDIYRKFTFW